MARPVTASSGASLDLDRAIELFARGFSFTRSFTHPCVAEPIGAAWVVRDGPRKRAADYRREEWIARGAAAAEKVDAFARKHTRGRFCICAVRGVDEPDVPIRAAYRALDYRLNSTEALMACRLTRLRRLPEPFPIERVRTPELADRVAKAARRQQALPQHLADNSPVRLYVALAEQKLVGWLQNITVDDSTWVSSVYVDPAFRRRGIGRSMLARMLRDDRASGAKWSVLLASHTGALLYPRVGFEHIGQLLLYTPNRRRRS
jgi:ribosomal protein S18 acetylase RimI-like enzyme